MNRSGTAAQTMRIQELLFHAHVRGALAREDYGVFNHVQQCEES